MNSEFGRNLPEVPWEVKNLPTVDEELLTIFGTDDLDEACTIAEDMRKRSKYRVFGGTIETACEFIETPWLCDVCLCAACMPGEYEDLFSPFRPGQRERR